MKTKLILYSFFCCSVSLFGQNVLRTSTLDLSAGGNPYAYNYFDEHGGPAFGGRYEYRLWKYIAVEAGLDSLLPKSYSTFLIRPGVSGEASNPILTGSQCEGCIFVPATERNLLTLVPFGVKGILPLANGRLELFLGAGGAYAWHSYYGSSRDGLVAQGSLGGRVALDRSRHFWLGTSVRTYAKGKSEQWISWTADFSYRFGH